MGEYRWGYLYFCVLILLSIICANNEMDEDIATMEIFPVEPNQHKSYSVVWRTEGSEEIRCTFEYDTRISADGDGNELQNGEENEKQISPEEILAKVKEDVLKETGAACLMYVFGEWEYTLCLEDKITQTHAVTRGATYLLGK